MLSVLHDTKIESSYRGSGQGHSVLHYEESPDKCGTKAADVLDNFF